MSGGPGAVVSVGRVARVVLSGTARGSCVPRRPLGLRPSGRTDFPRRSGTSRLAGKRSTRSRWSSAPKGPREGSARTCRTPDQLAGVPAVVRKNVVGIRSPVWGAPSRRPVFSASARFDGSRDRLPRRVTGAGRRRPMAPYSEPVCDDNPSRALVRPVLKHGPRSLTCVRVVGFRAVAPSDRGASRD